jgi:hypothetical protein
LAPQTNLRESRVDSVAFNWPSSDIFGKVNWQNGHRGRYLGCLRSRDACCSLSWR